MGNVTTTDLTAIDNSSTVTSINNNIQTLRDEFDKVVYKDGREELTGNLDANTKRIINLPVATTSTEPLTLGQVETAFSEVATGSLLAEAILRAAGDAARPTTTALLLATAAATIGSTDGTVQSDITAAKARLTAVETITPTGQPTPLSLANALLHVQAGPRDVITYNGAQSVRVSRNFAVMGGFRFNGQYSRGYAPVFAMPSSKVADLVTMKGAETTTKNEAWYAVFACADNGNSAAVLRLMPYLRLGTPTAGVFPTVKGGEGFNYTADADYGAAVDHIWTAGNNLVGTEVLIISENGAWSGRVTTVTFNDNNEISFATPGALAKGDFVLVAPPGFDHYVWLGDFYRDAAEVRNIYDSGYITKSKMINLVKSQNGTDPSAGAFASGAGSIIMDMRGYISPLATMGIIDSQATLSTASTGAYAEYYDGDGAAHIVQSVYVDKTLAGSQTFVFDNIQIPFLYHQSFDFSTAGLDATRYGCNMNVTGWAVP